MLPLQRGFIDACKSLDPHNDVWTRIVEVIAIYRLKGVEDELRYLAQGIERSYGGKGLVVAPL